MEQRESNYEVMRHRMAELFLTYDISNKIRLWNLESDEEYVYLTFASDDYRVSKKTGEVEMKVCTVADETASTDVEGNDHACETMKMTLEGTCNPASTGTSFTWAESYYNSAMTIYDFLCYAQDLAHPSGNQVPMQSLSTVHTRDTYAGKGMFAEDTEYFAANGDAFGKACEALGGCAWGKGDYGYKLPIFQGLWMSLQVYEADEDFDAQMTILTDQNTLMYMHYETMWFMVGHVISKVRAKMTQ